MFDFLYCNGTDKEGCLVHLLATLPGLTCTMRIKLCRVRITSMTSVKLMDNQHNFNIYAMEYFQKAYESPGVYTHPGNELSKKGLGKICLYMNKNSPS